MADDDLVLITPSLSADLLLRAYSSGCFPWSGRPARWYCPDPRAVFDLPEIRFSKRLLRTVRQGRFEVTFDEAFRQVITACSQCHRRSWIDEEIIEHYVDFHHRGFAHSVETWEDGELVGGLYGVQLKRMFAGESMFHTRTDASKVAFYHLVQHLKDLKVELFDAQVVNPHTVNLGVREIPRKEFLTRLKELMEQPGEWKVSWAQANPTKETRGHREERKFPKL